MFSVVFIMIIVWLYCYCFRFWFLVFLSHSFATHPASIQTNWCYLCVCVHTSEPNIWFAHAHINKMTKQIIIARYTCLLKAIEAELCLILSQIVLLILVFLSLPSQLSDTLVNGHLEILVSQSWTWMCHIKIAPTTATAINS